MARKSTSPDGGNVERIEEQAGNIGDENGGIENGNGESEGRIVDPAGIEYGDEYERDASGNLVIGKSGKPRRKRGRRSAGNSGRSSGGTGTSAGKTRTRNSQAVNLGLETLSKTLMVVHMGLASFAKFDTFALEQAEADALSASIANVMEQFDWTPDPRMTAVAGLVTTSATIYGPRLYLYREHLKNKNEKKANNVKPFGVVDGPGIVNVN